MDQPIFRDTPHLFCQGYQSNAFLDICQRGRAKAAKRLPAIQAPKQWPRETDESATG